jgi:hypothetical protein
MPNHVVLNNVDHKDLKVNAAHSANFGADYGDQIMCTLAIPTEFRNIQADYPIFFHKSTDTDKFRPMVMFGFQQDENLYLNADGWDASYIPLMVERGPFLIGFQTVVEGEIAHKKMVISIDMDSARINDAAGEPLFDPFGGNSDYTARVVDVLQQIHAGQAISEEFVEALVSQDLIEPFTLNVELNNGEKNSLQGFHTINEEKLAALDSDVLADFHRRGILQAIYMVLASMSNIRRLIDLKNASL